ncbi:MAG: hypothetical protein NUW24_00585 [Anaerolineae bacterium]|jgi:hypothetical protein|nr:hypothetical protein [Anaerolineae bacterium]MDH7472516.1 hypothetical protein [Anaerolineae bacterium]
MNENELEQNEDMLPEYHLDYRKARPNRFVKGIAEGSLVVVLEPELAQVYKTPERVKAILEAIAQAMASQEPHTAHG